MARSTSRPIPVDVARLLYENICFRGSSLNILYSSTLLPRLLREGSASRWSEHDP